MTSDPLPSTVQRHRAAVLAGATGQPAVARGLWADDNARVRAAALGALHRLRVLDDDMVRLALRDRDPVVRRRALTLAVERPAIDIEPLLADQDDTVIEHAAWACGERPATDAIVERLIVLACEHREPLVREAAVAALGSLGDERGLDAILRACTDRATVRRRAILALAPFDGPAVRDTLRRALADRDWQVRQSAEDLGAIIGLDESPGGAETGPVSDAWRASP